MTTMLSDAPSQDRRAHSLRPLCIDAADAHARGWVTYETDGPRYGLEVIGCICGCFIAVVVILVVALFFCSDC